MKLPEKNKEVTLTEIKEICVAYGLTELWTKIEKDPPKNLLKATDAPCGLIHGTISVCTPRVFYTI